MPEDPNSAGGVPDKPRDSAEFGGTAYFAKKFAPEIPPSKPLQWFLFGALVITGAAYVVGEWHEWTSSPATTLQENRLRHLVQQSQSEYLAHVKSGDDYVAQKRYDQSVAEYRMALQDKNTAEGHEHLGQALLLQGNSETALAEFKEALRLDPARVGAASAWGLALAAEGKPEEAARVLQDALQRNAEAGLLHYNLVRAVSEDASLAAAHFALAVAEDRMGKYAEAIEHYGKVLALTPDDPATLNNLALLYATATNAEVRSPKMAVQLAIRACDATTDQNARYMDTLARSYAEDLDFFQAITWEDKAIRRATQSGEKELAGELLKRQALYTQHKTQ